MTIDHHDSRKGGLNSVCATEQAGFSLEEISAHFLTSVAMTEGLIMDAINKLANGDASEVSRIIALKSKTSLKEADDKERHFAEFFLRLALSECRVCAISFEEGDLLAAFSRLALANQHLGVSDGLNPSEKFKALRSQAKVLAGAVHANQQRVAIWNNTQAEFKGYWQLHIDPAKRATDAAILLERSPVYENANPKPKRSTLENYVRAWQAVPLDKS